MLFFTCLNIHLLIWTKGSGAKKKGLASGGEREEPARDERAAAWRKAQPGTGSIRQAFRRCLMEEQRKRDREEATKQTRDYVGRTNG